MAEAFRGEFYQKVDSKARVSIPAAFRRILEAEDPASAEFPRPRVYMVYGGKARNFVECYSKAGADALAAKIEAMELGADTLVYDRADQKEWGFGGQTTDDGRYLLQAQPYDIEKRALATSEGLLAHRHGAIAVSREPERTGPLGQQLCQPGPIVKHPGQGLRGVLRFPDDRDAGVGPAKVTR